MNMFYLLAVIVVTLVHGELEVPYSTPNQQLYTILSSKGINISDNNFVNFKVKACNDVHFALMSGNNENDPLYEIVIGGWSNTKSVFRTSKQGTNVVAHIGTLLDCSSYKDFWVSWADNTIQIGTGLIKDPNTQILTWMKPDGLLPILNGGIYTAYGSTGEWIFFKKEIPKKCKRSRK